jgi:hypothetical protein
MSFEAVLWATSDAPIADVNEFAVLVMLAEKADPDGCNTFPSRPTVASRTRVDSRTVLRCLQRLEERGLIAKGDQRAAEYIRADRRPVVYDLLIPYSWFPNIERINKERQERGRAPLTPADRPDISAPPEKVRRSDLGKKRSARGVSQSPRKPGAQNGHGVSLSPPRGVSQSGAGCLTDTRTSPLNQPKESLSPVVAKAEDARGRATEEREKPATPKDKPNPQPTSALPSQRAADTPPQPQEATQTPASTAERVVRKTGVVPATEEAVSLVLTGWASGAGLRRPPASVREQLTGQVAELAAEYTTAGELRAVAEFAGARRWVDLGRAAVHPECGKRLALVAPRPVQSSGRRERCPDHPRHLRAGCLECAMAVPV